jgi:hypothetical protein
MDTPRTGKTKKKVGKVIKFPLHKVRKPKTDLATQQSKEKAKEISENIFIEQLVECLRECIEEKESAITDGNH